MVNTVLLVTIISATLLGLTLGLLLPKLRQQPTAFLHPDKIRKFNRDEFEVLLTESFRQDGFIVRDKSADGVDFELEKNDQRYLVLYRDYCAKRLPMEKVRELHNLIVMCQAAGGFLVTAGIFGKDAFEYAHGKNIQLIDGQQLVRMFEDAQQTESEITDTNRDPTILNEVVTQPKRVILCPRCGQNMVKKTSHTNGRRRQYYGCSSYPSCKGRREIA
ncbi:MAG: restriction endonuclease [Gammaproteobacteria bacterium]|nr:restriction endonuclease [Gammaproteobacteria bacterium]